MAAKQVLWNVEIDGIPYKIELAKNKITINDGESIPLSKFKNKSKVIYNEFNIPVAGKEMVLYSGVTGTVLTMDGRDCATGKEYIAPVMPKWAWIFVVLYAVNFFLLIGGAIGGAISAGFAWMTISVASSRQTTGKKFFICLGIYIGITIIEFFLALFLFRTMNAV